MVRKVMYQGPKGGLKNLVEYERLPGEKKLKHKRVTWFEDD